MSRTPGHDAAGPVKGERRQGRLGWPQRLVLAPLRLYQRVLSPLKPVPSCRFHPTCSSYAVEAVQVHGALRGLWLAATRLLRGHPWHPGGFDPVPPRQVRSRPADASSRPGARVDGVPAPPGTATEES